ncbi:hypothetical protein VNO78_26833 [Psophocarpus tetragonolobus]|uniref:Annexin n=1 Tax=Psophocarpus tetragonolobus TaxID=3891 RepID=A0AAN9X902_PSOTE
MHVGTWQLQDFNHKSTMSWKWTNFLVYPSINSNVQILLAYVTTLGLRHEDIEANIDMAEEDAKLLYEAYKAGKKKQGTGDMTFVRIFSERSAAHLAVAMKEITSSNFALALLTIVQCAKNRAKYFAKVPVMPLDLDGDHKVLHMALECKWSGSSKVTRVIVTRAEFDLHYISAEYFKKYEKNLEDEVYSKTTPCYRDFLLSLMGAKD